MDSFIALQPILALLYLLCRRHRGVDNVLLVLDAYVFLDFYLSPMPLANHTRGLFMYSRRTRGT